MLICVSQVQQTPLKAPKSPNHAESLGVELRIKQFYSHNPMHHPSQVYMVSLYGDALNSQEHLQSVSVCTVLLTFTSILLKE